MCTTYKISRIIYAFLIIIVLYFTNLIFCTIIKYIILVTTMRLFMINTDLSIWAEIDLEAIDKNFDVLSAYQKPSVLKLAVLKADAYGHGAVFLAEHLKERADYYGVARIEEGIELRKHGITTSVLVLGHTPVTQFENLLSYGIIPTVYDLDEAIALDKISSDKGCVAKIHIAIDTGMSRIGFSVGDESIEKIRKIYSLNNLRIEGIFSHLANADDLTDRSYTEEQIKKFNGLLNQLSANGIDIPIKHLYNSSGICSLDYDYDMIRMGICLYGNLPDKAFNVQGIDSLIPVMSLYSKVINVHEIPKGTSVGYNCTYTADKDMTVATVSAGYADGYPRLLSNRGHVLINGQKARILGRICMDQFMCDVTDINNVKIGTNVTLFGKDGNEEISALEIGMIAETNSYEILCGISKRVPRVYISNGEVRHIHYGITV